jgi:hypothetical protein
MSQVKKRKEEGKTHRRELDVRLQQAPQPLPSTERKGARAEVGVADTTVALVVHAVLGGDGSFNRLIRRVGKVLGDG